MSFVRLWRYRVPAQARAEFARRYAHDGDWAALFARGEGFLGTELLRAAGDDSTWLTLDRWRSAGDWRAFEARHADAYAALDRDCEALTSEEEDLGDYEEPA